MFCLFKHFNYYLNRLNIVVFKKMRGNVLNTLLQVCLQDLNSLQYLISYCLYYVLKDKSSENSARSWFDLLYNWPPNSELLLNNSLLELIYFLNKNLCVWIFDICLDFTVLITNSTQVTSRVPYCCVRDKTFTSLNIVKHVESSFENPYTVWGCIFKRQQEELLRNESDDVVMWRHLTQTVTSSKRISIKTMATPTTKCFNTVWQR